NPTPSVQ
ncbi:surface antigen family, partial [Vibrio parahaemolyticus EKP-028]